MTNAQYIALARPCRLAIETLHPRLRELHPGGFVVVLSVNTGYE